MGFFPFSRDLSRNLFLGRMSESLHMHRNRCGFITGLVPWSCFCSFTVERGFPGRLSEILIMQLCRCDSFTPRGGGQRERRRTLRSPSPFSPTPLNLFPGDTAAAGLIIAAAGLYQYSLCNSGAGRSSPLRRNVWVLCVRAGIACVSVGMLGLYRLFFICADEKKTALVRCLSHVLDYR